MIVCFLLTVMFGLSLELFAVNFPTAKVPVKKDGKQVGYIEFSFSEGQNVSREGWGQEIKVSLFNNTDEFVKVTVILKGDGASKHESLKPYQNSDVSFWTEKEFKGVAVTDVYVE